MSKYFKTFLGFLFFGLGIVYLARLPPDYGIGVVSLVGSFNLVIGAIWLAIGLGN